MNKQSARQFAGEAFNLLVLIIVPIPTAFFVMLKSYEIYLEQQVPANLAALAALITGLVVEIFGAVGGNKFGVSLRTEKWMAALASSALMVAYVAFGYYVNAGIPMFQWFYLLIVLFFFADAVSSKATEEDTNAQQQANIARRTQMDDYLREQKKKDKEAELGLEKKRKEQELEYKQKELELAQANAELVSSQLANSTNYSDLDPNLVSSQLPHHPNPVRLISLTELDDVSIYANQLTEGEMKVLTIAKELNGTADRTNIANKLQVDPSRISQVKGSIEKKVRVQIY